MMHESKLERLMAGKSEATQNRLRKALHEARLTDDDALWPFLEVLDIYGAEMSERVKEFNQENENARKIHDAINKNLRGNLSRQMKQMRDMSLAAFSQQLDKKLAILDENMRESAQLHGQIIQDSLSEAAAGSQKRIKQQQALFSEKSDKEIEKILETARKNQADPMHRLIAFSFNVLMGGTAAVCFALLFLSIGHEAALGNTTFAYHLWSDFTGWIGGLFSG